MNFQYFSFLRWGMSDPIADSIASLLNFDFTQLIQSQMWANSSQKQDFLETRPQIWKHNSMFYLPLHSLSFNTILYDSQVLHSICMLSHFSHVWLFATPWTAARQAPLSMAYSRQEHWSGVPCRPPGGLPNPGITPASSMAPALQADSLPLSHCRSPIQYLPLPSFIYSELWVSTGASQVVLVVKKKKKISLPMQEKQETRVQSLGQEDPLEKEMAIHSSILAWEILWTEDPGRLQSMGS